MFKNYQLEDLLRQLLDAKKAESEKYYNGVANNVGEGADQDIMDKSPIERVSLAAKLYRKEVFLVKHTVVFILKGIVLV